MTPEIVPGRFLFMVLAAQTTQAGKQSLSRIQLFCLAAADLQPFTTATQYCLLRLIHLLLPAVLSCKM